MPYPTVVPEGWLDRFFGKADLERSFAELRGGHFHVETLRGRIRSIQLRIDEAWDHFDRAEELVEEAEETIPNLVRQFLLEVFRFQNALAEAPLDPATVIPPLAAPWVAGEILDSYPEVRFVLSQRKRTEAQLRLHTGEIDTAIRIFEEILKTDMEGRGETLATCYLGLAACHFTRDSVDECARHLENAAFAVALLEHPLHIVETSARLAAFFGFLEDSANAREWKEHLLQIDCPDATKEAFLERAIRLQSRCAELGRLVLL